MKVSKTLLSLLRVFFPSWRFFSAVQSYPRLSYRFSFEGKEFSPWIYYSRNSSRAPLALFCNTEVNLYLAGCSLVEQLVDAINEFDQSNAQSFAECVSYQLTQELVRAEILKQHQGAQEQHELRSAIRFQFRVSSFSPNQNEEEALISLVHEV